MKFILAQNAEEELALFQKLGSSAYYAELGTLGVEGNVEYHFDHHGVRAHLPTALSQVIEFVNKHPDFPKKPVVLGLPLDLDCACTALILTQKIKPEHILEHLNYHEIADKYGIHIANRIVGQDDFWNALMMIFGKITREVLLDEALFKLAELIINKNFDAKTILSEYLSQIKYTEVLKEPALGFIAVISYESNPFFKLYESFDIVAVYNQKTQGITIGTSYTTSLPLQYLPAKVVDLTQLFDWLNVVDQPGWGGRENIGGSPKGLKYSEDDFIKIANLMVQKLPEIMKPFQW